MIRIRYTPTALSFLEGCTSEQYHDIRGLVVLISQNPDVDGKVKILVSVPPVFLPCYVGPEWWILYELRWVSEEESLLIVLKMGKPSESAPNWRR